MTKKKGRRTKRRLALKNATRQIESRHYIRKTNKQTKRKKKHALRLKQKKAGVISTQMEKKQDAHREEESRK